MLLFQILTVKWFSVIPVTSPPGLPSYKGIVIGRHQVGPPKPPMTCDVRGVDIGPHTPPIDPPPGQNSPPSPRWAGFFSRSSDALERQLGSPCNRMNQQRFFESLHLFKSLKPGNPENSSDARNAKARCSPSNCAASVSAALLRAGTRDRSHSKHCALTGAS